MASKVVHCSVCLVEFRLVNDTFNPAPLVVPDVILCEDCAVEAEVERKFQEEEEAWRLEEEAKDKAEADAKAFDEAKAAAAKVEAEAKAEKSKADAKAKADEKAKAKVPEPFSSEPHGSELFKDTY